MSYFTHQQNCPCSHVEQKKPKKYKVSFHPNMDQDIATAFNKEFDKLEDAQKAIDLLSDYTLMLHDSKYMPDFSNMALICEWKDGCWEIIQDGYIEIYEEI